MIERSRRAVLTAIGSSMIAGCSMSDRESIDVTELQPGWTADLDAQSPKAAPRVLDGSVYVDNGFDFIEIPLERPGNRRKLLDTFLGSPAVRDVTANPAVDETAGRLLVPTELANTGTLYSIDPETGIEWETKLPGGSGFAPIVDGDEIAIQTDEAVSLLDREIGEILWSKSIRTAGLSGHERHADLSPALIEDRVLVPTKDGLQCFSREDGSELWNSLDRAVTERPAVDGDRAYVPVSRHGVKALDLETGRVDWETDPFESWTTPVVGDDRVYVAAVRDMYAFERTSGDLVWHTDGGDFGGAVYTDPTLVDDRIVVGSSGYAVLILDREGTLRARSTGTNTKFAHAVTDDGIVAAERTAVSRYDLP
ncbi:hypothetical protein C479_13578 [Halovivax asiaticus JCM 14624]|uniref:Pyrrolo-quinoline quinone repeat domain-containing protein n=1 Tax=Halovivax asiaticus JCM 14624 TaxID=1227490 RepID=M0BDJ1_9EURY|nr:PQQ-binding-like beta-propeller repeat protein [Halovivax asiaticus]ELZ08373.1 hypothetical protein C479_13578 [Halovivax asiaticus JCM 14624]